MPRPVPSTLVRSAALGLLVLSLTASCRRGPDPATAAGQRALQQQQEQLNEQVRQQLEMIPPPVKAKFMAVRSLERWENPYITVQEDVLVLHVTIADANESSFGAGGMLRPANARKQNLTIRPGELAAALNAVPNTSWPYGRVVAVEEAHGVPTRLEPQVRRTMETALRTLNQLGLVIVEWGENGPSLR